MHWTVILKIPQEGFPGSAVVKNLPVNSGDVSEICGFDPGTREILWSRKWQPTPVFLPGESDGQRSLVGYSPWGRKESDMTEQLRFTSLTSLLTPQLVRLYM